MSEKRTIVETHIKFEDLIEVLQNSGYDIPEKSHISLGNDEADDVIVFSNIVAYTDATLSFSVSK